MINKVYSADVKKGRCKESDDWEIVDVKLKHVGYYPLDSISATTNPYEFTVSGVTYTADRIIDSGRFSNNGDISFYIIDSKYENGVVTEPKIFNYDYLQEITIPDEIKEKLTADANNPHVILTEKTRNT